MVGREAAESREGMAANLMTRNNLIVLAFILFAFTGWWLTLEFSLRRLMGKIFEWFIFTLVSERETKGCGKVGTA